MTSASRQAPEGQQGGAAESTGVPPSSASGLIRAKLSPHRLPQGAVHRPDLLDRLRDGRDKTLTLVTAPAGYGKSTLLSEWVATDATTRFAWVSLDAMDSAEMRMWTHVTQSLGGTEPAVGDRSLPALRSNPKHVVDVVLPVLLDELSVGTEPLVLVLDDYHLAENSAINTQVAMFLRYRPARVQVVVSTRSDPDLGVAALRASGDIVELRAEALRFDERELVQFFDGAGVSDLTAFEARRLSERTGGWPAPLRLVALVLPGDDRGSFIQDLPGASSPVVDYLTRDVLEILDADTRELLLRSSILDRFDGGLCDAVLETTGSGARLAELERLNVLVTVDRAGQWYEMNDLFAQALRLELSRSQPSLLPALHARAAAWLEVAGYPERATDHSIAARDLPRAVRLVAGQLQSMASAGRLSTIRRWLSELSWPEAERDPELAFVRAVASGLANDIEQALERLAVARTGPPDLRDAAGLALGFRVDFLTGMIGLDDVAGAEAASRRAMADSPNAAWEGIAMAGVGQALYLNGHTDEAVETLRRAVGQIPDRHPIMLAFAVGNLGLAESALGVPSHADPMIDPAMEILVRIGAQDSVVGGVVRLALGERERRRGDVRGALTEFDRAVEAFGHLSRSAWLVNAYLLRAAAQAALGMPQEALASVDNAERFVHRLFDPGALPQRVARLRTELTNTARHETEYGEQLSDRELVVLRLASEGLNQRQIADQLFISYNTVKSHLRTTYRKLGVASRDEAIAKLGELVDHGDERTNHPGDHGAGW